MRLSIIVPVYQVQHSLERCVRSITQMAFDDYELLLVDDCSPDESGALCDRLADEDSHIRVIHRTTNGGLSAARNTGIQQAQGNYLTFIDSDDYIDADVFTLLMRQLELHPEYDLLEYAATIHEGAADAHALTFSDRVYHDAQTYWYEEQVYAHAYACNKVYRRALFGDDLRYPEGKIFEDIQLLPHLLLRAKTVATTAMGRYHYVYNPQGITVSATGRDLRELLNAHLTALSLFPVSGWEHNKTFAHYYAHILNIQQTGDRPVLPPMRVQPLTWKLLLNNLIGTKHLCQLCKLLHRTLRRSHS